MSYHHTGFHGFSLHILNNPQENVTVVTVSVFTDFLFTAAIADLKTDAHQFVWLICTHYSVSVSSRTLHFLFLWMNSVFPLEGGGEGRKNPRLKLKLIGINCVEFFSPLGKPPLFSPQETFNSWIRFFYVIHNMLINMPKQDLFHRTPCPQLICYLLKRSCTHAALQWHGCNA